MTYLLFSGCCLFSKHQSEKELGAVEEVDLVISSKDENQRFSVEKGDKVVVELKSNPSTGYQWKIIEGNTEILNFVSKNFVSDKAEPGMVGVGGTDHFNFTANKKGNTVFKFEYSKKFESEGDISKFFQFDITVK